MFPPEFRQAALRLFKDRSASETIEALKRIPEFKDRRMPVEKTLYRWRTQAAKSEDIARESSSVPSPPIIPKWAKNMVVVHKDRVKD